MPICFMGDKLSLPLLCFDVDFYIMMWAPIPIPIPRPTSQSELPSASNLLVCCFGPGPQTRAL